LTGWLHILDVSNPASPVEIGGIDLWIGTVHTEPYSVQVVGTLAYVTYGSAGLRILDVSDPASPLQVGEFDTMAMPWAFRSLGRWPTWLNDALDRLQLRWRRPGGD
jgi:hypothetical protein